MEVKLDSSLKQILLSSAYHLPDLHDVVLRHACDDPRLVRVPRKVRDLWSVPAVDKLLLGVGWVSVSEWGREGEWVFSWSCWRCCWERVRIFRLAKWFYLQETFLHKLWKMFAAKTVVEKIEKAGRFHEHTDIATAKQKRNPIRIKKKCRKEKMAQQIFKHAPATRAGRPRRLLLSAHPRFYCVHCDKVTL